MTPATPRPDRHKFPRSARIRTTGDFARVRHQGKTTQGGLLRLSIVASGEAGSRFGLVTSRRVGKAVDRVRVRRRLREIIRAVRPEVVPGWLVVTSAKSGSASANFDQLRDEWLLLARRLSILRASA